MEILNLIIKERTQKKINPKIKERLGKSKQPFKWKLMEIISRKMKPTKKLRKNLNHVKKILFIFGHPRIFWFWGAGNFICRYDFAFFWFVHIVIVRFVHGVAYFLSTD